MPFYNNLAIVILVVLHVSENSDKDTAKTRLKWVHVTISNAIRNFIGNNIKSKESTFNFT